MRLCSFFLTMAALSAQSQIHSVENAIDRMGEFESQAAALGRVRGYFEDRLSGLREQLSLERGEDEPENPGKFVSLAEQRLWWELAKVEREAVLQLRREQEIGDEGLHEIEREIDLLEARLVPRRR